MKTISAIKVAILSASNYITVLVNTVLFPIFPVMAQALNLTLRDLAILVGIVSFPSALINLGGGILADRFGKKIIIVLSLTLYGLGGLLAGLSIILMEEPYPVILVGRLFQGIGAATPMFLSVALVGDIFQSLERSKALGFLETANGLGKVTSPILGALIGLITWYSIFFIYPIVALPVAIATWKVIEEPNENKGVDWEKQKKAFRQFKDESRIITLLVAFLVIFILIGTMFWLSDFLEARLELNQILRGVVISLPALAMLLTTLFAERIHNKLNPRFIMGGGLILTSACLIGIYHTLETILFWPLIVALGVGAGIVLPSVDMVSTSVEIKEIRGVMSTIYGSARSLGGATTTITFSYLLEYGLQLTFYSIAVGGIIVGLIVLFRMNEKKLLPKELLPDK
ncbi:MFS transporter [Natranaerobius thermophilus]|uniref:Major facilitator superfamily MFS_1 n=1 Tax=Natranaerobius thermophilus (strain ATCC BAA-1301 / DSM 18059 / JW/NM-WN-LF) TaxID=457570 RepID=B2A5I4_NATTJ|nr:MFS transporter [Natranaerobius thermophilus]ACB85339.1 major facilitator superfamily MFS_1 [Natranaerobius thermophilus JW/NM-WN-LF]